jgi:hypothetical protein
LEEQVRKGIRSPAVRLQLYAPFVPQWMSRELTALILSGAVSARDDPEWSVSGAASPEDYALWSHNWCGMVCVKMVLSARGCDIPLMELCRRCTARGGYVVRDHAILGLFYAPAVVMLQEEFHVPARVSSPLSVREIVDELQHGHFVIASVHPTIRHPTTIPPSQGGHLVLLVGFDLEKETLLLHNPSGDTRDSQEYCEIACADFEKFFAHRGIIIEDGHQAPRDEAGHMPVSPQHRGAP